jgi:putative transposase
MNWNNRNILFLFYVLAMSNLCEKNMSTYSVSLQHIVFATKWRQPTLDQSKMVDLNKFLWSTCQNKLCVPFAINGHLDHMHILANVHPAISISDLVKTLKISSNRMIKETKIFPGFSSWQEGFGCFSCSWDRKDVLINYINNQESHHSKISSKDELIQILNRTDLEFDLKFLH